MNKIHKNLGMTPLAIALCAAAVIGVILLANYLGSRNKVSNTQTVDTQLNAETSAQTASTQTKSTVKTSTSQPASSQTSTIRSLLGVQKATVCEKVISSTSATNLQASAGKLRIDVKNGATTNSYIYSQAGSYAWTNASEKLTQGPLADKAVAPYLSMSLSGFTCKEQIVYDIVFVPPAH